jgi:hypothetical protein
LALDYLFLTEQGKSKQSEQNICFCHQVISVSTLNLKKCYYLEDKNVMVYDAVLIHIELPVNTTTYP